MEIVLAIIAQLMTAGAIYGGIRADIRNIQASTTRAHERIDSLILKGNHHA